MKKTLFFLFVFLLFCSTSVFPTYVQAEEQPAAYGVICIMADGIAKDSCDPGEKWEKRGHVYPCVELPAALKGDDDHAMRLDSTALAEAGLKNKDIYVIGCITTTDGYRCTVGNDDNAKKKLESLKFNLGEPFPDHTFKVLEGNPIKTDANGNAEIFVESFTPHNEDHSFYGIYEKPKETKVIKGDASSPQYATINFTDKKNLEKCISINWDPKGRVFDAKSLEPIPNVQVSLLDEKKQLFSNPMNPGFKNPVMTLVNGVFNFFVPNGIYYLNPKKTSYNFPVSPETVHENYTKAYYCDPDVKKSLYFDEYPIPEHNKLVHCDVPFDPGTNIPYRSNVKTITYGQVALADLSYIKYEGTVSHPLTKIALIAESTGKEVAKMSSDKFGYWAILLPNAQYPKKEDGSLDRIIAQYTKVDLTTGEAQETNTPLQSSITKGITFEPIPRYIEGYAYDDNNAVFPHGNISIQMKGANTARLVTTADEKGFFTIEPKDLPMFDYVLKINAQNSSRTITYTPTQFAQKNKKYLKENDIDLITATKKGKSIVPGVPSQSVQKGGSSQNIDYSVTKKPTKSPENTSGEGNNINQIAMIIAILLLLIIAGFGAMYFFIKQKNNNRIDEF